MVTSPTVNTSSSSAQILRADFNALLNHGGVFELTNRAKIELTGRDRVRWLNGQITNNIRDLAVGRGVYAFIITPQGRILADLYAYNLGESLLIDTDKAQGEKVLQIFRKYIIMDKVELNSADEKLVAVGVAGHESRQFISAAGIETPQLEPLQLAKIQWRDTELTMLRTDHDRIESYELWLEPAKAEALHSALTEAGAAPINDATLEVLRIAESRPKYGQDITERDLPQETGQMRALSFTKGCYIGQEIVERIRSRGAVHRQFSAFRVEGPMPAPGTKITGDGKEIGEITSAAVLPVGQGEIAAALGYIRREAAVPGARLIAGESHLTIVTAPFI